jgi:plastocyanin
MTWYEAEPAGANHWRIRAHPTAAGTCLISQVNPMPRTSPPPPLALLMICLLALTLGAEAKDAGVKKIEIKDRKYAPAKLTIKAGQTVVWTNRDDSDHTIVADDGSFGSGDLSNGESYKFTFKKKGKFKYHCKYHPREKGEITVE